MKAQEDLNIILERAELKEKKARRNAIIYSIIPVLLAVGLIVFTSYQVSQSKQERDEALQEARGYRVQVEESKEELVRVRKELKDYQTQVKELQERLVEATNFVRNVYELDWEISKILYSRYPRQTRLLTDILEAQRAGVSWKLGGTSPQEGFDSPSFATYLLKKHELLDINQPGFSRYELSKYLPQKDKPDVGDLIFYEAGYAMFYFEDRGREFVIGITPIGIVSLKKKFGPKILSIRGVEYE